MYKHILIATDGSELAAKALTHGLALAKAVNAKVTVATVTEPWTAVMTGEMGIAYPVEDYDKAVTANAAEILQKVLETARGAGVDVATLHVKDRFPADGIIDTANERGCDLIVMASHGRRGLTRLILGSQTQSVVTHSTIPVLVCR